MPDLAFLKRELELAERGLACADIGIDDVHRRAREMADWQRRIVEIKRQIEIAERDGFNPYGSGPVPIEPRGVDQ